jgi:hypothetical protein
MQIFLKGIKGFMHFWYGREHEFGLIQGATWSSDPILAATKLSGSGSFPTYAFQEVCMEFPDQA